MWFHCKAHYYVGRITSCSTLQRFVARLLCFIFFSAIPLPSYSSHDSKQYSANAGKSCNSACVCDLLCHMVTTVNGNYELHNHCSNLRPVVGNSTVACYSIDFTEHRKSREHC